MTERKIWMIIIGIVLISVVIIAGCSTPVRADEISNSHVVWSEKIETDSIYIATFDKIHIPEDEVTCFRTTNGASVALQCFSDDDIGGRYNV